MSRYLRCFCPWLLLAIPGCSPPAPPAVAPASGTLTAANGKPLPGIHLEFVPVGTKTDFLAQIACTAGSNPEGKFKVESYWVPRKEKLPGLPPGKYKVKLIPYANPESIPDKYREGNSTPLEVTIPESGASDLQLQVK